MEKIEIIIFMLLVLSYMNNLNYNENDNTTDESEYDNSDDSDQDVYFDDLEESNSETINNDNDIPCLEMENGKFKGSMIRGKMEGYGVFYYNDGSQYRGDWENGKRSGKGNFISHKGTVYNGDWKDDKMNGKGSIHYLNGNSYDGYWKDNKFSGYGVLMYNNKKYIGIFENGNPKGRFNIVYSDGTIKVKMFNEGLKVKEIDNFNTSPSPSKVVPNEYRQRINSSDNSYNESEDIDSYQKINEKSVIRRKLISLINELDDVDKVSKYINRRKNIQKSLLNKYKYFKNPRRFNFFGKYRNDICLNKKTGSSNEYDIKYRDNSSSPDLEDHRELERRVSDPVIQLNNSTKKRDRANSFSNNSESSKKKQKKNRRDENNKNNKRGNKKKDYEKKN